MKRIILTALAALGTGALLLAQQPAQQPAAQSSEPVATVPKPKSQGELKVVQALFAAAQQQNADAIISNADELLTKYKDTEFKEYALTFEAAAYEQKGDWAKEQTFLEQVLDVNPKNPDAKVRIADIIIKHTHENDLDKEDKLTRADKLLNQAIEDLKAYPKPNPTITDAQWDQNKKFMKGQAEELQGLAALDRKQYDQAATHLKAAIEDSPEPAYQAQLASALQQGGKYDEAIAVCDKLLADPQLHPTIKQYVTNVKAQSAAAKAKGGAK
jgi:tetratricopeptide (TPR) repeat protein